MSISISNLAMAQRSIFARLSAKKEWPPPPPAPATARNSVRKQRFQKIKKELHDNEQSMRSPSIHPRHPLKALTPSNGLQIPKSNNEMVSSCKCGFCLRCVAVQLQVNAVSLITNYMSNGSSENGLIHGHTAEGKYAANVVIDALDVPTGVDPLDFSVFIDDDATLVVQAGRFGPPGSNDGFSLDVSDDLDRAIEKSISFAKMVDRKEKMLRQCVTELMCTNTSVSHMCRKYGLNLITITKYYRLASEFLKGETPRLRKGKRPLSSSGAQFYNFRRTIRLPDHVNKATIQCYLEPWDGRLVITASPSSSTDVTGHQLQRVSNKPQTTSSQQFHPHLQSNPSPASLGPSSSSSLSSKSMVVQQQHFNERKNNILEQSQIMTEETGARSLDELSLVTLPNDHGDSNDDAFLTEQKKCDDSNDDFSDDANEDSTVDDDDYDYEAEDGDQGEFDEEGVDNESDEDWHRGKEVGPASLWGSRAGTYRRKTASRRQASGRRQQSQQNRKRTVESRSSNFGGGGSLSLIADKGSKNNGNPGPGNCVAGSSLTTYRGNNNQQKHHQLRHSVVLVM